MRSLASLGEVVAAVSAARSVRLASYVLRAPALRAALERAAERGAAVDVRLERRPYAGSPKAERELRAGNAAAVRELRAHGVHARLSGSASAPLHLKAAVIDGVAYLDDRNWAVGRSTIVRTTDAADVAAVGRALAGAPASADGVACSKARALELEAATISEARPGDRVDCESEAFGASRVAAALAERARHGAAVRLLVGRRAAVGRHAGPEIATLRRLQQLGVEIRWGAVGEKICLQAGSGWVGSANATAPNPQSVDWGMNLADPAAVATLSGRFERAWAHARPWPGPSQALPSRAG